MKYYYDILLNFDEYPINYYEWSEDDTIERFLRIPVFRVENISDFIKFHMKLETDEKVLILSDGINAIALEVIDGSVAYLSYLCYEDENCVNEIAANLDITNFKYQKKKKRYIPFELRSHMIVKKLLLQKVNESSLDFIKYIYYDVTGREEEDVNNMRIFLLNDIETNFNDKYVNLYQKLCQ